MLQGMVKVLARKWSLKQKPPHSFLINEKQQGGMEHHSHEESVKQPKEEVYGDFVSRKDNLEKLLENLLMMKNLEAEKEDNKDEDLG